MNAVIIDDESHAIENLSSILKLFELPVKLLGTASSVEEGVKLVDDKKPDLLFLDIEMPLENGFELLKKTSFNNYQVIFITAYSEYAIQALRLNALDYIMKPIDPDDLEQAIKKANKNLKGQIKPNYKPLIQGHSQGKFEKLGIPTAQGIKYIDLNEIIRLQASSNYTEIHAKNDKPILVSKTLKNYEKILPENHFIRVHQSHLVNKRYVKEYNRGDGSYLVLSNGDKITVSKSKRSMIGKMMEPI